MQVNRLGIIAALPAEAKCLAGRSDTSPQISRDSNEPLISISGIGSEAAHHAASSMVEQGVTALISWGCAGALSAKLNPGDLLLPETILAGNGQRLHTHAMWRKQLTAQFSDTLAWHEGILMESSKIVSDVGGKKKMAHVSGAVAVDMESAAIGWVAHASGIPFMVIRAVADAVDEAIPSCIANAMDCRGSLQMRRLLPMLLRQSGLWPQLVRLGYHFHAATRTLKTVSEQYNLEPLFYAQKAE